MKTSFLILFFFCICLLVGHGLVDAMSIAPRRKTLDAKQPNFNVYPNSCGGGGGDQCSQLAQKCFNAGNIFFHWRSVDNGPVQFTFTFADDCCKAASQIGNYCARDGFYKIITKACTGNNGGGNDHSGHNNHNGNGNGNGNHRNNGPKGLLGTNGSPQCSPIVQKCMYGSSHFSYSFRSGSDGVIHYVYDFAPDCCSAALQITGDCAQDADVTIITGTCRG